MSLSQAQSLRVFYIVHFNLFMFLNIPFGTEVESSSGTVIVAIY